MDYANTLFRRHYQPQQDVCVDETLVGTRGRTAMLQYIPSKHSRFCIKFWVLAESATGYMIRMTCYLGNTFQPVKSGACQGTTVVMYLLRESPHLGRGYHVFCDRFFTSIELAKALRNHRTFLTGTIRSNRRLPATIKDANVDHGTTYFMRQGDHLAAHKGSNSRRPVRLLSTAISADSSEGVPQIIKAYNNMGWSRWSRNATIFLQQHKKIIKGVEKDGLPHSPTHVAQCICVIQIKHHGESD